MRVLKKLYSIEGSTAEAMRHGVVALLSAWIDSRPVSILPKLLV